MKKIFTLIVVCLATISTWAYDVNVDGICYNLDKTNMTAEVTYASQNSYSSAGTYSGDIIIPQSFTRIGQTYKVTKIGYNAFCGCKDVTSVSIPNTVTIVDMYAFSGCTGLASITIPDSVTKIGYEAFYGCSGLTSIIIPNSVTTIATGAFECCQNLKSVTMSNSITELGWSAFSNTPWDTDYCANQENIYENIIYINDIAYKAVSTTTESCNFKESTRVVAARAFWKCLGITSIIIPNSVTHINGEAFSGCGQISKLTIGKSVVSIGNYAFAIGGLDVVKCYAENVPDGNQPFGDSDLSYITLKVPSSSVEKYKATYPWSGFGLITSLEDSDYPTQKCIKPTIVYSNCKLKYSTETNGATVVSSISVADAKTSYDKEVSLTATYEISAYATKSGYEDSEKTTAALVWATGTLTNGINQSKVINTDAMPLLISQEEGMVTVSGLSDGDTITAYGTDGKQVAKTKAVGDAALMNLSDLRGKVAVLSVNGKSAKVVIK